MALFMKIDGIDGEATATGYEKWIEALEFEWGANPGFATDTPTEDRQLKLADLSRVIITKSVDASSPAIFLAAASARAVGDVELHFTKQEDGQPSAYLKIFLTKSLIGSWHMVSAEPAKESPRLDRPTEKVYVKFTKASMKYVPENNAPIPVGFNLETAEVE